MTKFGRLAWRLIERRSYAGRWVYVVSGLAVVIYGLIAAAMGGLSATILYIPLLALCIVQFVRPTLLVWFVLTALFSTGTVLVVMQLNESPANELVIFLSLMGAPAVALIVIWPRSLLQIRCIFDPESGRSGIDPFGTLAISVGPSAIRIEPTYLDSWLVALAHALLRLQSTNQVSVEVSEEPKPLRINISKIGHVVFTYGGNEVTAASREEFKNALTIAARSFLNELKDAPDVWQNRFMAPIRRFVADTDD